MAELRITSVSRPLLARFIARASFRFTGSCWWKPLAVAGGSGASRDAVDRAAIKRLTASLSKLLDPADALVRQVKDEMRD